MNKLSRSLFWVGVFVATMALAIGVSLLAVRVRAAMDARRGNSLQVVTPASDESLVQPVSDPSADTGTTSCVTSPTVCQISSGSEPSGLTAAPSTAPTPATYRDCCGNIRVVPTPAPQSNSGAQTAPQQSGTGPTPEPPASCH